MTDEEINRKFDVVADHLASLAVGQQRLQESQAQTAQPVNRLTAAALEGFKDTNAKIDALADANIRLSEAQARTDESLRNLIAVVDRYFSEGATGRLKGEKGGRR